MDNDEALWRRLVAHNKASVDASEALLRDARSAVQIVRRGLHGDVIEAMTSLGLLLRMKESDRMALFGEVLPFCLRARFAPTARQVILSLPREWVVANIVAASESLLEKADHLDYLMMISLYRDVDLSLACQLAHKAAESNDYDVREVGEAWLRSLNR